MKLRAIRPQMMYNLGNPVFGFIEEQCGDGDKRWQGAAYFQRPRKVDQAWAWGVEDQAYSVGPTVGSVQGIP